MIGVQFPAGAGNFFFETVSRPALEPTQPPIQWVSGTLYRGGVKRPRREADRSPISCAEVKECVELYLHSPSTPSWRGIQFKKSTDNFPFTFYLYEPTHTRPPSQQLLCNTRFSGNHGNLTMANPNFLITRSS
jgi:hypothetical protein